MASPKAIAIFALLTFGRVHAENDDEDCDDETTALSTTFATSIASFTKTASSTATTRFPGGQDNDDNDDDGDDCDDDDNETTTSQTTFATVTNTASSTSTTTTAHSGHAPLTCTKAAPKPDGLVCGKQGYISRDEEQGRFPPTQKDSLEECATLCATGPDCAAFSYREGGHCQIFIRDFSTYGFTQTTSGTYWFEKDCYECSDSKTVLDVDFRSGDISDWSLTTDRDETFFLGTRNVDGLLALWVLEATTDGLAQINYDPTFKLNGESTYELGFAARSSLPVDPENGLPDTNFKLMAVYLSADDKVIYENIPTGGVWNGGQGWFKFSDKFIVPKANAGSISLKFTIQASGQQLDWFLGNVYITKV
ncbi:hypothetical protein AK830_g10766 [Neonectria ditissima]|uniref:Apple domain-containing protein n=1 Tax=Neonectria ditissima TaxID=78410 RepID=A0A0P7B6I9_9HYPO|nr:hypothetical protein AK830_g10766 [Neonectria ditissima]